MIHYNSSILTAQTVIGLLQNNSNLSDINIQVKVDENGLNQQGFRLYNQGTEVSFFITEDTVLTNIIIFRSESKGEDLELAERHDFDRDFDYAADWLSKELQRNFPKWNFSKEKN